MNNDIGWHKKGRLGLSALEFLHLVANDHTFPVKLRREASLSIKKLYYIKRRKRKTDKIGQNLSKGKYEYQCKHCLQKFTGKIKAGPRRNFCSKCKGNWILKKCEQCGCDFSTQNNSRFCSLSCSGEFRKNKYREENFQTCKRCGKKFFKKGFIYCSRKCAGNGVPGKASSKYNPKRGSFRRRAKLFGVEYEVVDVFKVFERDLWRCQICGKSTPLKNRGTRYRNAPEIDHRIPLSKGGGHLYNNVQCACRECNNKKSNKTSRGQLPLFDIKKQKVI